MADVLFLALIGVLFLIVYGLALLCGLVQTK